MKKLIFLVLLLFIAFNCHAAPTVIYGETTIDISSIDADWQWNSTGSPFVAEKDMFVTFICFVPGATSDKLVLLEEDANGASLFPPEASITGASMIIYVYRHCKPFIDYSASTFSSGHKVIIGYKK